MKLSERYNLLQRTLTKVEKGEFVKHMFISKPLATLGRPMIASVSLDIPWRIAFDTIHEDLADEEMVRGRIMNGLMELRDQLNTLLEDQS